MSSFSNIKDNFFKWQNYNKNKKSSVYNYLALLLCTFAHLLYCVFFTRDKTNKLTHIFQYSKIFKYFHTFQYSDTF